MRGGSKPAAFDPFPEIPELGPSEDFPAGTELFRQGHRPTVLRLIVSGFVKTIRQEPPGDAVVAIRKPGWMLGLAPAVLKRAYTTSGFTATACTLRALNIMAFEEHLRATPALAAWALRVACSQNQVDDLLRAEMAIYKAPERLVRTLVRLVKVLDPPRRSGHVELALPITLRELAQMVGATPEHLRHLLADLEARGALRRRRGILLLPLDRWPQLAAD
jgi:CRP-like cAMP-binding protein